MTDDRTILDLGPPARHVALLLDGVADEQLTGPTPCDGTPVAALLDHLMGLTLAFRHAAQKTGDGSGRGPTASAAHLDPDWRLLLPARLDELVAAWSEPTAWEGMTEAGGVTMPAAIMGRVAIDELVLHGWDLARATGQPFDPDPVSTQVVFEFTTQMSRPEEQAGRDGLFGPIVDVPPDAGLFDRALGLSGRNPAWTPSSSP